MLCILSKQSIQLFEKDKLYIDFESFDSVFSLCANNANENHGWV